MVDLGSKNILCLDTSELKAQVVLITHGQVFTEESLDPRSHSQFVNPAFEKLLEKAALSLKDLNGILVNRGPGSFTGLRVSATFAKTYCQVLNLPLYSTTSFELLSTKVEGDALFVINAFKNKIFINGRKNKSLLFSEGELLAVSKARQWVVQHFGTTRPVVLGNGLLAYPELMQSLNHLVHFQTEAESALQQNSFSKIIEDSLYQTFDWKSFSPLYLRASAAEENLGSS